MYFYHTYAVRDQTTQENWKSRTFLPTAFPPTLIELYSNTAGSHGLQLSKDDFAFFCPSYWQMSIQHNYFKWYFPQKSHKCVISIISSWHRHYRNKQVQCTSYHCPHKEALPDVYRPVLWYPLIHGSPLTFAKQGDAKITATDFQS